MTLAACLADCQLPRALLELESANQKQTCWPAAKLLTLVYSDFPPSGINIVKKKGFYDVKANTFCVRLTGDIKK